MTVTFEGKEYTLTQDAYYQNGCGMYCAHANDSDGNDYMVYWEILYPLAENEDEMCEWDSPIKVEALL